MAPVPDGPDGVKLRASCDGCYNSKIRCGKQLPSCSRCLSHGIVCRYSPSQRVGKPRRVSEGEREDGSKHNAPVDPPILEWDFNSARGMSHIWQQDLCETNSDGEAFSIGDSSISTPQQLLSPLESVHSQSNSTLSSTGLLDSHSHATFGFDPDIIQAFDPVPLELTEHVATTTQKESNKGCTCGTKLIEMLHLLHKRSSNLQTPFDVVLSTNKEAVESISSILACPCQRDPTSVITIAAIVTKMISWYQSACGINNPKVSALSSTVITLGSAYRLEQADEDSVKFRVMMNELKKVDELIAKLSEKFCKGLCESKAYEELVAVLRLRLKEVVEGLQKTFPDVM
ncbi:MAG: hypothetical protein Q9214_005404 [Letrouitia sp. 1 TL-2023]